MMRFYDILPFKLDFTAPRGVMKGIPLKVAIPSSFMKKSSATLPYALLALFPGSAGSDL